MAEKEEIYKTAYLAYEEGQYSQAADLFAYLIALSPSQYDFWKGFAASEQMNQHYESALRGWVFAALLSPEDPLPHVHAAQCLISLNQKEDAAKAIHLALKKTPLDRKLMISQLQSLRETLHHG